MKIEDRFSSSGTPGSTELRPPEVQRSSGSRVDGRGGARKPDPGSDTAGLSSLSLQLSRGIEREPPETVARIERLQQAVANETYAVSSSQVSRRIVDAALGADF